jgi:hypothetical protein
VLFASVRSGKDADPAIAVGRALYDGQSLQSIVHTFARTLTYLRPNYYLRLCMPTMAELESVFLAAVVICRKDVPVPPKLASWVQSYANGLRRRLAPTWRAQLARVVDAYSREGRAHNLEEWGHAVDATARRVGLLLTSDLQTVVDGLSREPLFTAGPSPDEKVKELLVHSVSNVHFELRERLGITVR